MAIFTAIAGIAASVGSWFAGLGVVTQAFVRIGAGLVFNALSAALAGKPEAPKEPGIVGELQQGADVRRAFIMGRRAVPGSLVYHNQWGPENEMYTRITALSDLPITGLDHVWVDGVRYELDKVNPHPDYGWPIIGLDQTRTETRSVVIGTNDDYGTDVYGTEEVEVSEAIGWVLFHDGTQTQPSAFVVNEVATDDRAWSVDDIGMGVAHAVTTFKIDRDVFQGLPELLFVCDGIPLFDPEASTTGFTEDPIVMARAILGGLSYGGQWFYGPEQGGRFSDAELASEIAKCKAPVPGADQMTAQQRIDAFGGDIIPARYRASIEVALDRQPAAVIEDLMSACNGRASEVGTHYRLQIGDPGLAVASITDDDILSSEGQTFAPFFPLAETVNAITATYPSPADGWQQQDAPPLYRPDLEGQDGNRRLPSGVALVAVPFPEQVQRLMSSALAEARRARRHSIVLPAEYWYLEPGDFLDWTSTRNGYVDKLFRVDGLADLPNGDVAVDLTEVDPSDYDWSADADFSPVEGGSLSGISVQTPAVQGWALEPLFLPGDAEGSGSPGVVARWTRPANGSVDAIQVQVRRVGGLNLLADRTFTALSLGAGQISEGIARATLVEGRGRFVVNGRSGPWTIWDSALSPDVRIGEGDIGEPIWDRLATDDQLFFDRFQTIFDRTIAELAGFSIDNVSKAILEQARVDGEIQRVEETFGQQIDDANAEITTIKETAISDAAALAQLTTTVNATFGDVQADITAIQTAAASDEQALATFETATNATLGDIQGDITTIQTANAADEQALATFQTTTNAAIGDIEADVVTVSAALASLESSTASFETSITSQFDTLDGYVSTQIYTKSETDSQISAQVNTVQSNVDNLSTTVTQVSTAQNGILGQWGVRVNANGAASGFGLLSGAQVSSFYVDADEIRFGKSNNLGTYIAPFQVIGANTYIKNAVVQDGQFGTLQLGDNAVIVPEASTRNDTIVGNGAWQTVHTDVINMDFPGSILIIWSGLHSYQAGAGSNYAHDVRFVVNGNFYQARGGTAIQDYPVLAEAILNQSGVVVVSVQWKAGNLLEMRNRTMSIYGAKKS